VIPTLSLVYNNPATTGLLTFTPALDAYGFVTITLTVQDTGGTANGGVDTLVTNFVVTLIPINDPPSMAPVANMILVEDSGWQTPAPTNFNFVQTIILTNISSGPGEGQPLTFTVTSTNLGLIPTPTLIYTQGMDTAILTFRPATNAFGVSRISVVIRDDGSSALNGPMSVTNSFLVSVLSANDPPRMNLRTNVIMFINAGPTNIPLTGINVGATNEAGQVITFEVLTESTNFITQPVVNYVSPQANATLSFSTITNVTGTETVTIIVRDTGGIANGGIDTLINTFLIEVRPINVAPTMDTLPNLTMNEDALPLVLTLNNVTAGGGEFQNITITATSSDPTILTNPLVVYTNNEISGTLTLRLRTNANTEVLTNGVLTNLPVIITVIARDNGGVARGGVNALTNTFELTVWPVNDQPRLLYVTNLFQTNLAFGNMVFLEDGGAQVLDVFGIDPGATNENQTLTLRAFSSNTNLIATNIPTTYVQGATNGQLTFTPRNNQFGTSLITVTLQDSGGTTNGGVNLFTNTFILTVFPVNDPPVGTVLPLNLTILEDSGVGALTPQGQPGRLRFTNLFVAATAVTNEANQSLTVLATTPDTNTITLPSVIYTSPDNGGFIRFAPFTNVNGTAFVEVVFFDSGGATNGGIDAVTNFVNITITPVNDPPTLDAFSNYVVRVNSGTVNVPISGVTFGPTNEIGQVLTMTALSGNLGLIAPPVIEWNPTNSVGTLFFQPEPNAFGTTTITVVLTDDGGRQNTPPGTPRGVDAVTNTFRVIVTRGNTPPTIDPVPNVVIDEGAGPQRIDLTGITVGPINEATQSLTVAISSSNPTLVDPVLTYAFPATTGSIAFTPPFDGHGSAVITVTVRDNGGTATNGVDTTVHSIYVIINAVNDPPTLDPILTNFTVLEDSGPLSVDFSGVSASAIAGELQTMTAFAFSSDTNILLTPTVFYANPDSTGRVFFQPASNGFGTATVSVVVQDSGGTAFNGIDSVTQAFTVVVIPVNDVPTIGTNTNRVFLEDSGFRSINFTNVTSGVGESNLLTFTVLSSRPDLISGGNVIFTNTNGVATLVFAPNTNAFGTNFVLVTNISTTNIVVQNTIVTNFDGFNYTVSNLTVTNFVVTTGDITNIVALHPTGQAVLTVVVTDDGGTENGGVDTVSTSFMVEVLPVNDPPQMDPFTNRVSLLVDAGTQVIPLSGIAPGPPNESLQSFTEITVTNYFVTLVEEPVQVLVEFGAVSNNVVVVTNEIITLTNQIAVATNQVLTNQTFLVTNQSLTILAISSNPGLIPTPQINYLDQDSTGELVFTPTAGQTGIVTITVIITDDAGRANGGINAVTNTFLVTVFAQNAQPTLSAIPNMTLVEGVLLTNVNLYGITAGGGEGQNLTVSVASSNTNLVRNIILDYTSPNDTGQLIFGPQPNASGTATITVTVRDDGGSIGGLDSVTNTFAVVLASINDAPGLDFIPDITIYENDPVVPVLLTNIFAGGPGEGGQTMTFTAFSSDTNILRNPAIIYISPQNTGVLNLVPAGDLNGDVTVTVIIRDNGGTAFGGIDATTNVFLVTVSPVNDAPRFTVTNVPGIFEDSLGTTVFITNITSGATNEIQTMTVTAFSSDTSIIPDPIVLYTNVPDTNGVFIASAQVIFRPLTNQNGTVTISVVVQDTGGTANGGIDTTTNTFTVNVLPVNDPPSFTPLANIFMSASSGLRVVLFTNLVAGPADETNQTMLITAVSSNPGLIQDPLVDYDIGDNFGSLIFQPESGAVGTATIVVIVDDDGSVANGGRDRFTNSFVVVVTRGNLPPTLAPLTNLFLPENAGLQTVLLGNITSGGAASESAQTITISSFSSDPLLLTNPVVAYVSPETNGILTFMPVANTSGVASITVLVRDSGSTSNGGFNTTFSRFTVTIFSAASRTLLIENFGPTNIVSWPMEATTNGFVLQISTNLTQWSTIPPLPFVSTNFNYYNYHTNVMNLTNAAGTNEYFRLYRP
ncbi:MAG: hypothetical protein HZA89_01530, partial [Verrucomicrobia bacterium]|nr:hypothetical protein [Verrucomicrobiota bacterium]